MHFKHTRTRAHARIHTHTHTHARTHARTPHTHEASAVSQYFIQYTNTQSTYIIILAHIFHMHTHSTLHGCVRLQLHMQTAITHFKA